MQTILKKLLEKTLAQYNEETTPFLKSHYKSQVDILLSLQRLCHQTKISPAKRLIIVDLLGANNKPIQVAIAVDDTKDLQPNLATAGYGDFKITDFQTFICSSIIN